MKASASGGARMLMRDSVAEMLRRIWWLSGSGCVVVGAGLSGRDGSDRYEGGREAR